MRAVCVLTPAVYMLTRAVGELICSLDVLARAVGMFTCVLDVLHEFCLHVVACCRTVDVCCRRADACCMRVDACCRYSTHRRSRPSAKRPCQSVEAGRIVVSRDSARLPAAGAPPSVDKHRPHGVTFRHRQNS